MHNFKDRQQHPGDQIVSRLVSLVFYLPDFPALEPVQHETFVFNQNGSPEGFYNMSLDGQMVF